MDLEQEILKNEEFFAKSLKIGIDKGHIIDKINAFDWLELVEATSAEQYGAIALSVFNRFRFKFPKKYRSIVLKAFAELFAEAVLAIQDSIKAISGSYNVEGGGDSFKNEVVDKFYYIEYWANKKNIPVNYNEKDLSKRDLFNFDTILISILSDKLKNLNEYERNKPKK